MDVKSHGKKVVFDSIGKEGNGNSNSEIFWDYKEIVIGESTIKITRDSIEETIFSRLPHSEETEVFLVDLKDYQGRISFDLFCKEDEYFFAIEHNYFKIWNGMEHNSNDSNGFLINFASDNEQLNQAKAQFLYLIDPKMQLIEHVLHDDDSLKTTLKYSELKEMMSYSEKERTKIDEILKSVKKIRLKYIVSDDMDLNINSNKFYFIKGKLDKSQGSRKKDKKNEVRCFGRLSETMQNGNTIDKPIAILVHGVASSCVFKGREIYDKLIAFLVPHFHISTFDYLTINQSIDDSGKLLAEEVKSLKQLNPDKKVIIIAHSMGGLVSRAALVVHKAPIDEIIMAGTPNNGSKLGKFTRIAKWALLVSNIFRLKPEDRKDIMHSKELKGLKDLGNRSDYIIKTLNAKDVGNTEKYYSIVGDVLGWKTDIVVSNRNMIHINNKELKTSQMHKVNSFHMTYFEGTHRIENSVGKALETLYKI